MDEQRNTQSFLPQRFLPPGNSTKIGVKPCPARECASSDAISNAELILKKIDERWPIVPGSSKG
jgi:hypothetical protein